MILFYFIASAAIYIAYHWLSYTPHLKDSKLAFWSAMVSAVLVAWTWLELAKRTSSPEKLFFYGLCWDAVVLAASLAIPLTLFNVKPSPVSLIGVCLFILGLILVKLGSNA